MEYFERVQRIARVRSEILEFQHFDIDCTICDFAGAAADADIVKALEGGSLDTLGLPSDFRLPAKKITFNLADASCPLLMAIQFDEAVVVLGVDDDGNALPLAILRPRELPILDYPLADEDERMVEIIAFFKVGYVFTVINQPRVCSFTPGLPRPQRRALHRGFGFAVDAWTRVSWDLSKETRSKLERDPSFHPKKYHFRCGHWRRAEQHYKGATQRPNAFRIEDRALWWQWIEEQWVGHPAFGIKKSVHAPKMSLGRLAKRRAA